MSAAQSCIQLGKDQVNHEDIGVNILEKGVEIDEESKVQFDNPQIQNQNLGKKNVKKPIRLPLIKSQNHKTYKYSNESDDQNNSEPICPQHK